MLVLIRSWLSPILKGTAAMALGCAILWQVAEHSGPELGIAYVHVTAPMVDVMIDDATYHVESVWEAPIVRGLRAGKHTLRMSRNGERLYEQEFTVGPGEEVVLTAWERSKVAALEAER